MMKFNLNVCIPPVISAFRTFFILSVCLFFFVYTSPAQSLCLIPWPAAVEISEEKFELKKGVIYCAEDSLFAEAEFLKKKLETAGYTARIGKRLGQKSNILLKLDRQLKVREGYRLRITPDRLEISGKTPAGVFYGIQTLLQLVEDGEKVGNGVNLVCCRIEDFPRYEWRGYMLDEARHFFGKEKVKQLLDLMAYFKLNKFHWHLTDEPGWRIEIKKYPRLTAVGGKGSWSCPEDSTSRYYTQEEIKEIVDYASERHIEIILELDMPGHATAANRAYPAYSGGGTPAHPDFTFHPGKEEVYTFLGEVLREVAGLFPSAYLHIGGDEVAFGSDAWKTDPYIRRLMQQENLKDIKEVENYFMHRMSDTVRNLGKRTAGWDELLEARPEPSSTLIFWWRHDRPEVLRKCLEKGFATVLCPRKPLYFDFIQQERDKWGRVWDGFCPLEDVYAFPEKLRREEKWPANYSGFIRGIQANLWTERVQNENRLDYMTFPRLCALAEAAWTPEGKKDFSRFRKGLEGVYRLLDGYGIYYFDSRDPEAHPEPEGCHRKKREVPMDFRD